MACASVLSHLNSILGGYKNCLDVKEKLMPKQDGSYQIELDGKILNIHCRNLQTSHPKEYLSLEMKRDDNFSEIFPKRLMMPYVCQNETHVINLKNCVEEKCVQERLKCDKNICLDDETQSAGLTVWNKISIDLTRRTIDIYDFTFTDQIYGRPVPYATGGDCYSVAHCPRGRFSINLEGTGIKLNHDVKWVADGHYHFKDIIFEDVSFTIF